MASEFIGFFFSIAACFYVLQIVFEKIERGEDIVLAYVAAKFFKRATDIFLILGLVSSFILIYKLLLR